LIMLKDFRQRKMVVISKKMIYSKLVDRYVKDGYGIIQVPVLSGMSKSSVQFFLSLTADQIQEFVKDKQKVLFLRDPDDEWMLRFLITLQRRGIKLVEAKKS